MSEQNRKGLAKERNQQLSTLMFPYLMNKLSASSFGHIYCLPAQAFGIAIALYCRLMQMCWFRAKVSFPFFRSISDWHPLARYSFLLSCTLILPLFCSLFRFSRTTNYVNFSLEDQTWINIFAISRLMKLHRINCESYTLWAFTSLNLHSRAF